MHDLVRKWKHATDGTVEAQWNIIAYGDISSDGSITLGTTVGVGSSITAVGSISGVSLTSSGYLAATGTTGRPITPTSRGCYLGCDGGLWAALEF